MDPIVRAKLGDLEFFKTVSKEVLLNARDADDYSALTWAIIAKRKNCVEEICRRCPELVYHRHSKRQTMTEFMTAVLHDHTVLTTLAHAAGTGLKQLIRMVDVDKRSALFYAVCFRQIEAVEFLLKADPEFEYGPDVHGETPLTYATRFASECTTPSMMVNAVRIRDLLIENQKSQQVKVGIKEHNWTELHKAASRGDIRVVREIIRSNPKQMEVVDEEKRNFVHLAAQFGHTEMMKFLLDVADVAARVFNAQDINGDTPLHIALASGNKSVILCLLYDTRVIKGILNAKGQKALDAITFEYDRELAKDGYRY